MEKKKHKKETVIVPAVAPPELINTWKEFYALLPEKLHSSWNEKCYRKLFSLAVRNGCKVFSHKSENRVSFRQHADGSNFILFSEFTHLSENSRFTAVPSRISLSRAECISTGVVFNSKHEAFLNSKGEYYLNSSSRFNAKTIEKAIYDVVWSGSKNDLESKYFGNKEYREQVEWKFAGSYAIYLVIKDYLWYKKGQIIDEYYLHKSFGNHNRSPLDLFGGGHYHSLYNVGNGGIACDLNKVTLKQLEDIKVNVFSCNKHQYGCQRGCTSYCYAEGANASDAQRKQFFIDTYKKLGLRDYLPMGPVR